MRVVTIGGGTGSYHVLRALMKLRETIELSISAITTTSDSGGSSGQLRLAHQIVAPGDIGQCALGLHPDPESVEWLLGATRFGGTGPLNGHTARNAIVVAAFQRFGLTQDAMTAIRKTFQLAGDIVPVTFCPTSVHAELGNGWVLKSEAEIYTNNVLRLGGIKKLWLDPVPTVNPVAITAIEQADFVIVCPGTLACSIIPNLLVPGIVETLQACSAQKIYVVNLMNKIDHEPADWTVQDHVSCLETYLGAQFFDTVVLNTQSLQSRQAEVYEEERAEISWGEWRESRRCIALPLLMEVDAPKDEKDVLAHYRSSVRHDPIKLAGALEIAFKFQKE